MPTWLVLLIVVLILSVYFGYEKWKARESSDKAVGMLGGRKFKGGVSRGQIAAIVVAVLIVVYLYGGSI
jgi:hypothetical protein